MKLTFICTSITKTITGYYVKFSKTEEIDKPAEIIKGQLVDDQKEIIIKVLPEQKDYYKTNETYVFDLFNSQKK